MRRRPELKLGLQVVARCLVTIVVLLALYYLLPVRGDRLAVAACELLGLRGPVRVDLMLDGDGALWLLEANAVPGMTDSSLLPLAAGKTVRP